MFSLVKRLIALLLIVTLASLTASASKARGDVDSSHNALHWSEATANWLAVDATGCVETRPFVFAFDAGSEFSVFVFILRVTDVCADVPLASFEGDGTLAAGELTVAGSLTSATVNKTFTAIDSFSGESREFTVNVAWASTSDLDPQTSSSHVHGLCNGSLDVQNQEQHFREAEATGSFSDGGTTTNLASGFGYTAAGTSTSVGIFPLPADEVCH
jgi:hypothetical protein